MPIARDDVAHLARLSRLALAEDELDHLAAQLDVIIAAVARVQEVAADGIPPTSHAVPLVNVFREDTLVPCLDAETVLSQAPAVEQQRVRVPRILAEDESMDTELTRLTAGQIAAAIRDGEVTAAEVTDAHLARIEQVDPRVRAFLHVAADQARAAARAVDQRRAAGGDLGPLA